MPQPRYASFMSHNSDPLSTPEPDWFPALVTRFAPSPTGRLHLGHAKSAFFAHDYRAEGFNTPAPDLSNAARARFILRIEDIDRTRCRPEFDAAVFEDLAWLGLTWEEPVLRQSERFEIYDKFLHVLEEGGLTYPCFCTRKEIEAEIAASQTAPHTLSTGPDGPHYPGTCKHIPWREAEARIQAGEPHAIRLHGERAASMTGPLSFTDLRFGQIAFDPSEIGDIVIARKDIPTSYHLSVVVDDALQFVSHVTRGEDLLDATKIHRLLQSLLGLPQPLYHHHALLRDAEGTRLAKRHDALSLKALRGAGKTPEDIRQMVL